MAHLGQSADGTTTQEGPAWPPVEIRLLGGFRLLRCGEPVPARAAGKVESLLSCLALSSRHGVPRETLLNILWPDGDTALAGQSLNSLIYSLRRLLAAQLADKAPVLTDSGTYRLNFDAGITVDVVRFDALVAAGDRELRANERHAAATCYAAAIDLYRGDLCAIGAPAMAIDRERLRASYLTLLARLADFHLAEGDVLGALTFAQALLRGDPCREDALRTVMRCYVWLGERAQALRHYRLTEAMLRSEFDAAPELATAALWDQIRLRPESV
jgi:DNA-binding SARP family transcriptional activator